MAESQKLLKVKNDCANYFLLYFPVYTHTHMHMC